MNDDSTRSDTSELVEEEFEQDEYEMVSNGRFSPWAAAAVAALVAAVLGVGFLSVSGGSDDVVAGPTTVTTEVAPLETTPTTQTSLDVDGDVDLNTTIPRDPTIPAAVLSFVDGADVEIDQSELVAAVASIEASDRFLIGVLGGAIPPDLEPQILTTLIVEQMLDRRLAEMGVEVLDDDFATADGELWEELNFLFPDEFETDEIIQEIDAYVDILVRARAKQTVLGMALFAELPEPEMIELPCASHILVATAAEAEGLKARIEAGESFGLLASEFSTDTGSGAALGSLGCSSPDRYVEPFRDAILAGEVGELLGPVETQFGFHLIVIDSRELTPVNGAGPEELVNTKLTEDLAALAGIDVHPEIGSWEPSLRIVIAPLP